MPWSNQSGGGGGGGGPWGQRGGGSGGGPGGPGGPGPGSPWGSGPGGGGKKPPDLEDIIRRGQDRLRRLVPGGQMGGLGAGVVVLALVAIWLATGFFTVQPNQVGLKLIFGRWVETAPEGLSYNFP